MGKLTTKIRRKFCRHKHVNCGSWLHGNDEWLLIGTCATCGDKVFRVIIKNACIEEMHEIIEQEKETTDKGAGEA